MNAAQPSVGKWLDEGFVRGWADRDRHAEVFVPWSAFSTVLLMARAS